jgi:hypothetical protein
MVTRGHIRLIAALAMLAAAALPSAAGGQTDY